MATNIDADAATQNSHKRPQEDTSNIIGSEKRIKTDFLQDDPALDDLFAALPLETKDGFSNLEFPIDDASGLDSDLPSDKPATTGNNQENNQQLSSSVAPESEPATPGASGLKNVCGTAQNEQQRSSSLASNIINNGQPSGQHTPSDLSRVNCTAELPDQAQTGQANENPSPLPLHETQPQLGIASTYLFQKAPTAFFPNQYRPSAKNAGTSPAGFKSGIRFDPKKTIPMQASQSWPMVPTANSSIGSNVGANYGTTSNAQDKDKVEDPSKLNDALAAAGVDIQREEELLSTNYNRSALNLHQQQLANRQLQTYGSLNAFLHPYHVAVFMNRTARDNGVMQNFMVDSDMLEFMSSACKEWLSDLVMKTVALARHRRRGIPAFNPKNKVTGKLKVSPPSQRSEVAKELRNLALRQKELEERRVAKRALLGLEKSDEVAPESGNKAGAEETLHRAANATAAMMTMNPSRKKYSWMTSAAPNARDEGKSSGGKDASSKQSSLIALRGDNGLRFREIRTGNMISSKDLLGVLEDERIGTSKAVVKGYARLKD